jgi:hypothetical protein
MLNSAKTLATDPNSLLPESAQKLLKQAGIDPNKIVNDLENKASAKLQKAVGLTPADATDVTDATDVPDVEKGEVKPTLNKISTPTTKVLTPSTQSKSLSQTNQNKTSTTSSALSSQPSSVKVSISTTPVTQAKPVIVSLPSINENKSLDSLESPVYTPGMIVTDLNTIISSPAILNKSKQIIKPIESTINNDAINFSPEIKEFLQKILQPYATESTSSVNEKKQDNKPDNKSEYSNNNKLKSNKVEIEPVPVSPVVNTQNNNKSKQQNNNKFQQNNKPETNSNKSVLQPTNNNKNKNEKPKVKLEINAEELAEIRQILSKRNKNYKVIK